MYCTMHCTGPLCVSCSYLNPYSW
jgi:hypothetical protein